MRKLLRTLTHDDRGFGHDGGTLGVAQLPPTFIARRRSGDGGFKLLIRVFVETLQKLAVVGIDALVTH